MNFNDLINQLDDTSKDIQLNVKNILLNPTHHILDETSLQAIALAISYSLQNSDIIIAANAYAKSLDETHKKAARSCANIMAMNNVYYRSIHLINNQQLLKLPAGLRMLSLKQHGIDNGLFELMSLAVSAINGCGMCLQAHYQQLKTHYSTEQISYTLKLSAILSGLKQCIL